MRPGPGRRNVDEASCWRSSAQMKRAGWPGQNRVRAYNRNARDRSESAPGSSPGRNGRGGWKPDAGNAFLRVVSLTKPSKFRSCIGLDFVGRSIKARELFNRPVGWILKVFVSPIPITEGDVTI